MSNYIEGKIVVWTIGGSFAISGLLFVGKIVAAILTAIDRKVKAIDAWIADNFGFIEKLTDFLDLGTSNIIGKGLVGLGI